MNYKVLPFTEENLKLEGAEVWHIVDNQKAKSVTPLKGGFVCVFDDFFGHYKDGGLRYDGHGVSGTLVEIRIPFKKLTREEAAGNAWGRNVDKGDWGLFSEEYREKVIAALEAYHAMKVNGEVED